MLFRCGNVGIIRLNLTNDSAAIPVANTTFISMAKFNNVTFANESYITVPAQSGSGCLHVQINKDGTIQILNASVSLARNTFFRAMIPVIFDQ